MCAMTQSACNPAGMLKVAQLASNGKVQIRDCILYCDQWLTIIGNEIPSMIRNVCIKDCFLQGTDLGLLFKT